MSSNTELTFAAICGARLAPALRQSDATASPTTAPDRATVLIYASCADFLGERIEAGEAVSTALARWVGEAEAALTTYRAARAGFVLIERRSAFAAPRVALAAIYERTGAVAPEAQALTAALPDCSPISRLIAHCALAQSPLAMDFDAELAASALAVTPAEDGAAGWTDPHIAPDLDALAEDIRSEAPSMAAQAALQAEIDQLRDLLDHAKGRKSADAARLAEQARKIDAQHGLIRKLERDLGEAQGVARQAREWLRNAAAT